MKIKKYDTILFDMDGTLIDSDPMIAESFRQLSKLYKKNKVYTTEELAYFSGPPIRDTLAIEFPHMDLDFMVDEFHRICLPLYKTHVFAYPNSHQVLDKLQKDGFKLGIVTNKQHDLTELALKYLSLEKYFTVIVGLNDVKNGKPSSEGMEKAIKEFNAKKAIYIGDNIIDLESATNANIDCCLVLWGPRKFGNEIKPTFFIKSYLELEDHLYEEK